MVANWECVRATSYIYPETPITDARLPQLVADGFEIGMHAWTNCEDWEDQAELETYYSGQLAEFATNFPSVPAPTTNRTHCITWSDWATQPKVELQNGIRLDTNYYYWPGSWIQNRPGNVHGFRHADALRRPRRLDDRRLSGGHPDDRRVRTDLSVHRERTSRSRAWAGGLLRGLHRQHPQRQHHLSRRRCDNRLGQVPRGANRLGPADADLAGRPESVLVRIDRLEGVSPQFHDQPWARSERASSDGADRFRNRPPDRRRTRRRSRHDDNSTIKGVQYAFFDAAAGSYVARYLDEAAPAISNVQATAKSDGTATVTWNTDKPADSRVDYGTTPGSLSLSQSNSALVTTHNLQVSGLQSNTTYYFRVTSAAGEAHVTTSPDSLLSPQSFQTQPSAPVLTGTIPSSPANANSPKVVGSAVAGSTVRIYAGADCSGSAIATSSALALEAGIEVTVADNSTSFIRATASNGAGPSSCSAPLTYVEDSSSPQTQIDSNPRR